MGILSTIAAVTAFLDHLWMAWNSSGQVQAKVAQMTQAEKDAHTILVNTAMHGPSSAERAAALEEIRKLTSE